MGLLDLFKFGKKRTEMTHPVFGRMVYQDHGVWEFGRFHFAPLGLEVEALIEAGPEGPNERHVAFVADLATHWSELMKACDPILRGALAEWIEKADEGDIFLRLKVESLDVFSDMAPDREWELMFWCEEAGHWPVIRLVGWKPTEASIDG